MNFEHGVVAGYGVGIRSHRIHLKDAVDHTSPGCRGSIVVVRMWVVWQQVRELIQVLEVQVETWWGTLRKAD